MAEDILQKCPPPTALDKHTLSEYAKKCGKKAAAEWVKKETGVEVGECLNENAKDVPECVANNYSITLDIVNEDGSVNWENVAHDAGAVGGIAVCIAMGASAAALPLCAKLGSIVADLTVALGKAAYEIGSQVLSFFFGDDEKLGTSCNYKWNGIGPLKAARYAALFFKSPKTWGWVPQNEVLGEQVLGTQGSLDPQFSFIDHARYWSRLIILRGLASATASIADDMARRTSTTFSQALSVLDPKAPKAWTELVRPDVFPAQSGAWQQDYVMNIGGLLSVVLQPNAIWTYSQQKDKGEVIVPRWQTPVAWAGVPRASKLSWYSLMFVEHCEYQTTVWSKVNNGVSTIAKLKNLPPASASFKKDGPAGRTADQAYWVYSIPEDIDHFVRTTDDATFKTLVSLWRTSLQQNLKQKIQQLRTPPPRSSTAETVVKVGAGAGLLWGLLKYLKVM